jgi:DNA-binding NtrC family response regulator
MNGIELLAETRKIDTEVPYLIMTAYGSVDIAVQAMKEGANDFITKPFEPEALCTTLRDVITNKQITNRMLGKHQRRPRRFLTADPVTEKLLHQAKKVAKVDSSVLILGESGTGKELVARYIHQHSPRKDKPFIAVNCGAMPADLLESEFFGHEEGSFTGATQQRIGVFELAGDGTIFLDEVGDMPAALQVKLLRALQENEIKRVGGSKTIKINPRIISATNKDIEDSLDSGDLREDFYYRIAVISLAIRPLRERRQDAELLIQYFNDYFSSTGESKPLKISPAAKKLLCSYPWPGNARELENVLERASILAEGSEILPEHLGIDLNLKFDIIDDAKMTLPEIASQAARAAEVELIQKILNQTMGNKTKAAQKLGVSYKTLLNKIKDYEIQAL